MAKSNFEKVESVVGWVRDKKITGYRISKETNAREMSIIALAQGRAKVKNISFETALGLIDFYDKNHEKFEDQSLDTGGFIKRVCLFISMDIKKAASSQLFLIQDSVVETLLYALLQDS